MNLNENFDIRAEKLKALQNRIEQLKIQMPLIEESFVRGGGKGGQKINKTSNAVVLKYPPYNLVVKVQKDRKRNVNRFLALRELVDQIEMKISPHTSNRLKQKAKIRKQKDRRKRRSKKDVTPQSP